MGTATGMRGLAAIFAGGFAGAIARVALAEAWAAEPGHWPWATFVANIAGALILGYVAARLREGRARLLLGTGFCGALTTFSTLQLELLLMLDGERYALVAAYTLTSVALGLAAVAVGRRLAGWAPRSGSRRWRWRWGGGSPG
jgi:fluoride exporter